ncbi:MAG: hypothetical protein VYD08_07585 [Pseudomonadota bacterium]|nr:hypothetical protein [Pseudomonadota bacterium]
MGEGNNKKNSENLIDFTVIKLKHMHKYYMDNNLPEVASDIMSALVEYQNGNVNVIWREGLPYVKFFKDDEKV